MNPQQACQTFILRSWLSIKMVPPGNKTVGIGCRVGSRNSLAIGRTTSEGRFRSDLHDAHEGAFFELFLHELLTNLIVSPVAELTI